LRFNQRVYEKFKALGAEVVFVSPMTIEKTKETVEEMGLKFIVLSDKGSAVEKKYNLVYTMPQPGQEAFKALGLDVPLYYGDNEWQIPIPAGYLIDTDGIIRHSYLDYDHSRLSLPPDFLKKLEEITKKH
jgi:peroxiredoxin